jgi:hypothetical protein
MNGRGRARRQPGRTRAQADQANRSAINMLKRQLHGHPNKLAHVAPPSVTLRPYYPLVLDIVQASAATEVYHTPKSLIEHVKTQLGMCEQDKVYMNIKIQRVDVFCMATGVSSDRPSVSMNCSSLTPTVGDPSTTTPGVSEVFYGVLKRLSDQGNVGECAKVSYTWPLHMADLPLNVSAVFTCAGIAGNLANTSVRFHVLWSMTDVAAPIDPYV